MEVKTVGVYGAGLMGRGIAQVALEGGYDVVLYNHRTPTLETVSYTHLDVYKRQE